MSTAPQCRLLVSLGALLLAAALCAGCGGSSARPPIPPTLDEPKTTVVSVVAPVRPATQPPASQPPVTLEIVRPVSDWSRSEAAADALQRMGPAAVPPLLAALQDSSPAIRVQAVKILAGIGPDAKAAVPQLRQALHDPDPQVQKWAARALGQIGPDAAPAIPELIDALRAG